MADNKTMNYEIASQNSEGEKHRQDVETASEPGLLNEAAANITPEHRDYLIQRHGTVDLDPLPSADPADPYNWPQWKKVVNLGCVAFHTMMTTFTAAAVIPAFEAISEDLGVSLHRASYLTSLQIAILGWAPLFWKPLSNRYGRRPIWLISTIGSLAFNIGCARSHSYSTMAICRAFCAFFISPPGGTGSGVVTETFFKKERATWVGMWTLLVTMGPSSGPFFMGFVVQHTSDYRWIYWILAITNGVQFITYLFLGPETLYMRNVVRHEVSAFKQEYLNFKRIDPTPLKPIEFIQPLFLFRHTAIWIPTVAYSMVFCFCGVLLTVEIPQLFLPKFGLNPQQLGLQFLGIMVGLIIGEQFGGRVSDLWMNKRTKKIGRNPAPEYRLWLSYGGFVLAMVGLIIFHVRLQQAEEGVWNITPIIGIAIAAVGNQVITTVLVTYAIDSYVEHSASIGVFVNVVRSTWGFLGPFWFTAMYDSLGISGSGGLLAGLIFLISVVPTALLQWRKQSQGAGVPAAIGQAGVVPRQ